MILCPLGKYQGDKFQAIIHGKHDGISLIGCAPVKDTNYSLGWHIQNDVNRLLLTIKIINDTECKKTATANQKTVLKTN